MTDREIVRAIRELHASHPGVNEQKILEAVMAEMRKQESFDPNAPPLSRLLRARLYLREKGVGTIPVVLSLLAGVLIITALATPADRALASWITGLFETGSPGGQPSLSTPLPSPRSPERQAEISEVVIGTAVLNPGGVRAELAVIDTRDGERCIALDIPARDFRLSDCSPVAGRLPIIGAATSARPAGLTGVFVLGKAPEETRTVTVVPANRTWARPATPASVIDPSPEIRARAGIADDGTYFVAYLTDPVASRLIAVARARSGRPLDRSEPFSTEAITAAESTDDFVFADPP